MLLLLEAGMIKEDMPCLGEEPRALLDMTGVGQRHVARLREIAASNITKATAFPRVGHANSRKTAPAQRLQNLEI